MSGSFQDSTTKDLGDLVQMIVEAVNPLRVILFGSRARGESDTSSDIDLMVVMPDGSPRRKTSQTLYKRLASCGRAVDVITVTEQDIEEYRDDFSSVIYPAINEGRELYVDSRPTH